MIKNVIRMFSDFAAVRADRTDDETASLVSVFHRGSSRGSLKVVHEAAAIARDGAKICPFENIGGEAATRSNRRLSARQEQRRIDPADC